MNPQTKQSFLKFQKTELTESVIYHRLSLREKDPQNAKVLEKIAQEEAKHHDIIAQITGQRATPCRLKIIWFMFLARVFGITFAVKLMEGNEGHAAQEYRTYESFPAVQKLADDEDAHEAALINLISEERLNYMGSVVLGLSDALVEFTGALAGFTFALQNPKLVALTGAITGIAAALSMGSSEYLSSKTEKAEGKHPIKAAIYTGGAYILTVGLLVAPYALLDNVFVALGLMLFLALLVIASFTFYYAVAKGENFKGRFLEMAGLSFGVAAVSFFIGFLLQKFTGIEA
ncbi:MAG: VIT1/CCC1 transporter family protein [Elusimicrobiaceae bacterium]|nr:VIT1/CCC1 transporter family protein [Elusimicrobiaceae bacterium]